ncbi:DNA-3-methyladenine glycosylase family protein [Lysinibacillus cavernae]|uniref:DNA-3-methyladenine glycosylase family protein n=1 Tax=Lysinibacillus cavernae TaxID=2666135 RepID=UPI0012D8CBE8|nr:DNA-3-methyladenine glycosylase [Lysinibacillus cavernae]
MTWDKVENDIILTLPSDFNLESNLGYLTRERNECLYEVDNHTITRIITIEDISFLTQLSFTEDKKLIIHFLNTTKTVEDRQINKIVQYIRDWFDLDNDLTPFYEMAKKDFILNMPVEKFKGLRVIGIPDLFEALCWGVLGQQINLRFAYALKRQFVEKFGDHIEYEGKIYWRFPSYKLIAQLTPDDFSDIKMTIKKSEYIIGIAKLMDNHELSKNQLLPMSLKDAEKRLTQIKGIGPWTANYVLMRCLRFSSAFPVDDVGLINSIKLVRHMESKPTKNEILTLSTPWENWQAYATFYLWRLLY